MLNLEAMFLSFTFYVFLTIIALMKQLSPKSITVMKYLGADGEHHFVIVDDITFPSLEDRLNYLSRLEYKLWADGEIVEHIWTKTSSNCEVSF